MNARAQEALKQGLQLVLIWGTGGGDSLSASVKAQLDAWRARFLGSCSSQARPPARSPTWS